MAENKKISLETIQKEYESVRKYHSATLKNGEVIRYFNKFSEAKIKKLMLELHEAILADDKQPIKYFSSEDRFYDFIYFLIIKYFTDLGKEFPDGYEESIRIFSMLIELELFKEILEDVLPIDEVGRVFEEIIKRAKVTAEIERRLKIKDNKQTVH